MNYDGEFESLTKDEKEVVMKVVADFHIRNAVHQKDGSKGEIRITPGQMNDALAFIFNYAFNEGIGYETEI